MKRFHRGEKGKEAGIALFMVISAVAVLSVLVTELTYSTQVSSRLAYNALDNLRAYYLAKAAYRFSLVRLNAYSAVKNFVDDPKNKNIKAVVGSYVDRIWDMPVIFPPPLAKDAPASVADPIKEFVKESALSGTYLSAIFGESSKINLNNLFIKEIEAPTGSTGVSAGGTGASGPTGATTAAAKKEAVDCRPMIENTIFGLLRQRMETDEEFADVYRSVTARDIVDAMDAYLKRDARGSSLPGFSQVTAKEAPFYSISELHLIPGIDDELYDMLAGSFTTYSTPGINVNTATRATLWGLLPELTEQEMDDVMRKRDDPDVGQPWTDEKDFWAAVSSTGSGASALNSIQDRFKKAGLNVITTEGSFRVGVEATVGQATRRIEAYVVTTKKEGASKSPPTPPAPGVAPSAPNDSSSKRDTGNLQLVYWRSI